MLKNLVKFVSEIYVLKRNRREGFRLVGVDDPDSLADHITITAQLAYIIGEMEGLDGGKCAAIALFHDNGEARINDQHKVAARYLDKNDAERNAFIDQMTLLPENIGKKITQITQEFEKVSTPEGRVARDADWLEAAIQAKIYLEQGYDSKDWIQNVIRALRTDSAKKLLSEIESTKNFTTCWWEGLKKIIMDNYDGKKS